MIEPSAIVAEGRAIAARPSVCLLLILLTATATLLAVPAAQAAPEPPVLVNTTPASPNTDLAPRVQGNSGVDTSSVPGLRLSAIQFAVEGEATIALYLNKTCEGPLAAEGTAEELDTTGIQIAVAPETTNFISSRQTDETGSSGCSNAIEYKHVKELPPTEGPPPGPPATPPSSDNSKPPAPPHLRTVPGGWANDNTPLVTGSAPGAATVKIYADPNCDGSVVAKGTAGEFAAGLPVRVVDNVVAVFSGVSVAGGKSSACSVPVIYVEDSLTPHTRITMGPASKTAKRRAIFRFIDTTGDAPGTTFLCKVDRRKWTRCASPLRLRGLRPKRHTVRVKAIDPAGNAEPRGAKRRFKVVPRQ